MIKAPNPTTTCTLQLSRKKQKPNEERFKIVMTEAIDESFSSFNNLSKQEIFFRLEKAFNITKEEIPWRTEDFADAIDQMFGVGAKLIEIRIIGALHKRIPDFKITPKIGILTLKEYSNSLRTFLYANSQM
ncbi:MAG: hypothetical protein NWE80_04315 [Candidatus Bathyarchaeota archaeon]|nr:hypothetical protein [Candidatus Bathyarchaeota archaeon]